MSEKEKTSVEKPITEQKQDREYKDGVEVTDIPIPTTSTNTSSDSTGSDDSGGED